MGMDMVTQRLLALPAIRSSFKMALANLVTKEDDAGGGV